VTTAKKDTFVKVPLWWAAAAAKVTKTPAALVWVYLLHTSWKARSPMFPLPNGWLERHGVNRRIKNRVLCDLEAAGMITVERRNGKSPCVTLSVL